MEPAEILRFLQEHSDWLSHATFWRSIGQMILFGLLRFLYRVSVFAEGLIDSMLLASQLLEHEAIRAIFNGMLIFSGSLTILTLIIIAVRKLLNPKVDLKAPIIRGLFTVALIASVPGLFVRGLEQSVNVFEHTRVLGTEENTRISMAIIRENVADMHYIANHDQGFDSLHETTSTKNSLTDDSIWHVDFSEVIIPDDISSGSTLHPLQYTTSIDSDGELGISKIRNGWFDLYDEGYFRWTANWGILYTTLPLITFFMICTAFMLLTAILDLIFLKLIIPILAPIDLETNQKMKHIAKDAGAGMLSIVLIGVSLSVFRILLGFIFALDINFIARLIYLSVAVTTCMKGSSAFAKYLGVDVSMSSGFKSMLKLGATGVLAAKGVTGLGKLAQKGVTNGVPEAAKAVKNISEGAKNTVGNASESMGQLGAEFAGLGAKDFMKVKAINAGDRIKEGLNEANPINKVKSTFDENIGKNFKEGLVAGDEKVVEGSKTLKKTEAEKERAKKIKDYDSNTPLPKFSESHEVGKSKTSYQAKDHSADIFKDGDISLSDGFSVIGKPDTSTNSDSEFTLPQFGLDQSHNITPSVSSNSSDEAQTVDDFKRMKTLKEEQPKKPKVEHSKPKTSSSKATGTPTDLNQKRVTPTLNTPKVKAAPMKPPTPKVIATSPQVTTVPRTTSTKPLPNNGPKVTSNATVTSTGSIPKQTANKIVKVDDTDEV